MAARLSRKNAQAGLEGPYPSDGPRLVSGIGTGNRERRQRNCLDDSQLEYYRPNFSQR